jgi:demethylmenaquinone methyltransferase/2-methoxy-6-polyprenyl-1,4-benzoquinol methylase
MTPSPVSEVALPSGGDAKRSYVRRMFTAIAPRYDLLNHLLSLNLDRRWRRATVRRLGWERRPGGVYLDLCAGTMDLAATLAREPGFGGRVVGADFVLPMLERGKGKAARLTPVAADALRLPFADERFDGAMAAFGIRNLADVDTGLAETRRVLRPGARFVALDLAVPRFAPLRAAFLLYFRRLLPVVGRAVSKHRDAYDYLPESVLAFPDPEAFAGRLEAAGFRAVTCERLMGGICALVHGAR